jgi:hypothetical protein
MKEGTVNSGKIVRRRRMKCSPGGGGYDSNESEARRIAWKKK